MLLETRLNTFKEVNGMAREGGIVFLGSDFFASLPINELATVFRIDEAIFNRSICGATTKSIAPMLNECVFTLSPCKIFLNFGEIEEKEHTEINEFIAAYEWLLYKLHNQTSSEIYVISVMSETETAKEMNTALEKLCSEVGCHYIDITSALKSAKPNLNVFNMLKYHLHSTPLDFTDIMFLK